MTKKRILVVEDDAVLARVLRDNLLFEGFEVRCAADGNVALVAAKEFAPDLEQLVLGPVTIDFLTLRASKGKHVLELTYREFELLRYLAERPDRVVHRDE